MNWKNKFARFWGIKLEDEQIGFYDLNKKSRDIVLRASCNSASSVLRVYYQLDNPTSYPEDFVVQMGFGNIYFHNLGKDLNALIGHFGYWGEHMAWERDKVRQFLTEFVHLNDAVSDSPIDMSIDILFGKDDLFGVRNFQISATYLGQHLLENMDRIIMSIGIMEEKDG